MNTSQSPLFLGFDLSTQQLKAIIISEDSSIVHESAVHFDRDLPGYGTSNGAVRGPDQGEVTSPVRMWLEAIDLVMQRVKSAGVDLSVIAAISGAGQVSAFLSEVSTLWLELWCSRSNRLTDYFASATRFGVLVRGGGASVGIHGSEEVSCGTWPSGTTCVYSAQCAHLARLVQHEGLPGLRSNRRWSAAFD
jgi:hypothetical protein